MDRIRDEWEAETETSGRGWLTGLLLGSVLWAILILGWRWLF